MEEEAQRQKWRKIEEESGYRLVVPMGTREFREGAFTLLPYLKLQHYSKLE
jgi:hypothetical protein